MHNSHDDGLAARVAEIRARPHWTWTDEDMDDLATEKQLGTLDRLIEKYQARKNQQSQSPQTPTEDLRSAGAPSARERA